MLRRIRRIVLSRIYGRIRFARKLGVTVGENCRLYITEFGTEPFLISIGDKVTITSGVRLLTHDGSTWLYNDDKGRRQLYRKIEIGSNVFIGVNSIILPGVKIGDNCIIAAGSVVAKSVRSGSIVGGNPARFIGNYSDYMERVAGYKSQSEWFDNKSYKNNVLTFLDKSMKEYL